MLKRYLLYTNVVNASGNVLNPLWRWWHIANLAYNHSSHWRNSARASREIDTVTVLHKIHLKLCLRRFAHAPSGYYDPGRFSCRVANLGAHARKEEGVSLAIRAIYSTHSFVYWRPIAITLVLHQQQAHARHRSFRSYCSGISSR